MPPIAQSVSDPAVVSEKYTNDDLVTQIEARDSDDLRRRYFWLVAVGILATAFTNLGATGVGGQPLKYLLKTQLHVQPEAMAAFFALCALPFYFKPLVGLLTDGIPLFGTRRRWYLVASATGAVFCWLLIGVTPHRYDILLKTIFVLNIFLMAISTVVGGLLVEAGQRFHATGRFTSLRSTVANISTLADGPIGGKLTNMPLLATALVGATVPAALIVLALVLLRERPVAVPNRNVGRNMQIQFRSLVRSKPLWAAVGAYFLFYFAPGFHTPLYYYQTNTLKLSQQFIGNLGLITGTMGIFAAFLYSLLCRRLSMRILLALCIGLSVLATTTYHFYNSPGAVMSVEACVALASTLAELSLLDLAARATPRGSEGLGYSLMLSIRNGAVSFGDVFGSHIFQEYHLTFKSLIWLNAGTTALVLVIIPFLPRILMRTRDGDPDEAAAGAIAASEAIAETHPVSHVPG